MKAKIFLLMIFTAIPAMSINAQSVTASITSQDTDNPIYQESYAANGKPVYYYDHVDEKPTFKGGDMDKFDTWFRNRVSTLQFGDSMEATVTFIVDTEGKVNDLEIKTYSNSHLKMLEQRIRKIPAWTPGMQNGEAVNTFVTYKYIYLNFSMF